MSGREHREKQRDNGRRLEIELAHDRLTNLGVGNPSSSLPDRIGALVNGYVERLDEMLGRVGALQLEVKGYGAKIEQFQSQIEEYGKGIAERDAEIARLKQYEVAEPPLEPNQVIEPLAVTEPEQD